jgi:predicted dehydrogenase
MAETMNRRDVLKAGALAGAGVAALSSALAAEPLKTVRTGFVGVGGRGTGLMRQMLRIEGVQVLALCDINEANLARAQDAVQKAGQPKPEGYSRSETDWQRLVERKDLDLVVNATPWQWHAPVNIAAMKAGKHAATEVPAALTVEECWEMVETSEKTGKHCAILENDCYYRETLMILNMLRAGLLGEPLYAEAGYMHDIRAVKFNTVPNGEPWRLDHSVRRNGNLYPTHPLGPIAWWMDINRGDCFTYLVSMSSKARALKEFAAREFGPNDRRARENYALGDVNVTLIGTEKGRTIALYHDTNTPRPKEHQVRLQCTKGIYNVMMDKIFIDGRSSAAEKGEGWRASHRWEDPAEYKKAYEHRIWKEQEERAKTAGHGGIDYMEMYRLVKNLREGKPLDTDVYDAASWSVIVPLSEASVAGRSKPMDIPDFTRGKWKNRLPIDPDVIV